MAESLGEEFRMIRLCEYDKRDLAEVNNIILVM